MAKKWIVFLSLCAALAALVVSCAEEEAPRLTFTHGIASGDVTSASVLLWTRVDGEGEVTAQVATDQEFGQVVASQKVTAEADADFVVKASIEGLEPGQRYFYRFLSPDGSASRWGRSRLLPLRTPPPTLSSPTPAIRPPI